MTGALAFKSATQFKGKYTMNLLEIAIRIGLVLFALYMLNQLYIVFKALRWRSEDKLIARALEQQDV